jgi:hypothetical protein
MALSKENALELLQSLEGYHQRLKELHWSTDNHSRHLLTDDIDDGVLEFEDELAEAVIGKLGEKFGKGDLKTLLPNAEELKGVLDEMEDDVNKFSDSIGGEHGYGGIYNVTDDFLTKVYKWKYLETLS